MTVPLRTNSSVKIAAFILLLAISSFACQFTSGVFEESFDQPGSWGTAVRKDVEGKVKDGFYELYVKENYGLFLATANQEFADAVYEVEATQIGGPLNNGYGMLFRVDSETDTFYVFEVSGDGFVWIGLCRQACTTEAKALVAGDWFRSPAVQQGLQATNRLKVVADGSNMTFFVNGLEVGRTVDSTLRSGDIAVMVEALGEDGVRVVFDNFKVTPLEDES